MNLNLIYLSYNLRWQEELNQQISRSCKLEVIVWHVSREFVVRPSLVKSVEFILVYSDHSNTSSVRKHSEAGSMSRQHFKDFSILKNLIFAQGIIKIVSNVVNNEGNYVLNEWIYFWCVLCWFKLLTIHYFLVSLI